MKVLEYIGKCFLMILALILNIIEGVILIISYLLKWIDYATHIVYKYIFEWTLSLFKKFNFMTVFKED